MKTEKDIYFLDFNRIENLAGTEPVSFSFYDNTVFETDWTKLFIEMMWLLYQEFPQVFDKLVINESNSNQKAWLARNEDIIFLNEPQQLCSKYWVETAMPPTSKMEYLKRVLETCDVDKDRINIAYKYIDSGYKRKDKEDFYLWLTQNQGIDAQTSRKYVSCLKSIEHYAREKQYISGMIYDQEDYEIASLLEKLKTDPDTKELFLNEGIQNKFVLSLDKLKKYKKEKSQAYREKNSAPLDGKSDPLWAVTPIIRTNKSEENSCDPYYKKYSLDPDLYQDITIEQLGLSNRLAERLRLAEVLTLCDLLRLCDGDIYSMHGLGQGSVLELGRLFSSFEARVNRARTSSNSDDSDQSMPNKTKKRKTSGDSIEEIESKPIAELYELNPGKYEGLLIEELPVSNKLRNTLFRAKITTISSLLNCSFNDLQQIRGFGASCRRETENLVKDLIDNGLKTAFKDESTNLADELIPFIDYIKEGDFSFLDVFTFSDFSMKFISRCRDAHKDLGPELVADILAAKDGAIAIYELFTEYANDYAIATKCRAIISKIPKHMLKTSASTIISLYSDDESITAPLLELLANPNDTLEQYLINNGRLVLSSNSKLLRLINWCSINVSTAVSSFFNNINDKGRSVQVIKMRAEGHTLEEVGAVFNVTRERVRQIEKKVVSYFGRWQNHNGLVQHLLLELDENNAFSSSEVISCLEEYGVETVYLLKTCKADDYYYDKQLDLFILEDQSLVNKIQTYVDELPDTFDESNFDKIIETAKEDYNYPENMLLAVFKDNYKKTGKIYHRSRLTLEKLYEEILRRYYPDGIHIYSEYQSIKDISLKEYGIDLGDRSEHAISSVIARICILRGRGIYKIRDNTTVMSDQLANEIKDFINSSDAPVFMTNTLYTLFEEDLLKEGIDNKYYLQGLLRDRFDDEWIFKRDYISKDPKYTTIESSIVEFIRKSNHPVKREDIQKAFPGVTDIVISFATNDPNVINLFGVYIHSSKLHFSRNDIEYLRKVLQNIMGEKGYCSCHDLFDYISRDYKEILTNNFITIPFSLFSVIEYLFRDEYRFNRPFISREDAVFEKPSEVLAEIIRDSDVISTQEVVALSKEYKVYIYSQLEYFDSLNDTHLLLDGFNLASISYIGVDENVAEMVERAILSEITKATPISQLHCVSALPAINVQWNAWLIYSVLKKWSDKLVVFPSDSQFKKAYPIVSLKDKDVDLVVDDGLSHDGNIHTADDLSNIDDLIESYLTEELGVE